SALLNALYRGETPPEEQIARLLSLFRLGFADPADMREDVAGGPVYLAMAMDSRNRLRLNSQNLLVALPLRAPAWRKRARPGGTACPSAPFSEYWPGVHEARPGRRRRLGSWRNRRRPAGRANSSSATSGWC